MWEYNTCGRGTDRTRIWVRDVVIHINKLTIICFLLFSELMCAKRISNTQPSVTCICRRHTVTTSLDVLELLEKSATHSESSTTNTHNTHILSHSLQCASTGRCDSLVNTSSFLNITCCDGYTVNTTDDDYSYHHRRRFDCPISEFLVSVLCNSKITCFFYFRVGRNCCGLYKQARSDSS